MSGSYDNTPGGQAEALARTHLEGHGVRILACNYRAPGGEIDIIGRDGDTVIFCEVRLRRSSAWGDAAASITSRKQQRIILAARHYLASHPERAARFDCLLLDALAPERVRWLRDAFAAPSGT